MIDILQFYKDKCDSQSYYRKFYATLSRADGTFVYADSQEIVDKLREICEPPETNYLADDKEFLLLCFWLNKHGYVIKEFPNILSRPVSLYRFAYEDMRKYIRAKRGVDGDKVAWSERRELCSTMSITTNATFQLLPSDVETKIRLISTRGAEFDGMARDEQLQNLNNLIENLLKPRQNGNYLTFNYDNVFYGFISEGDVKRYRKRTQPFRHATEDTLLERASITEDEKKLLVQLGVFIAIHLYNYLNNTQN